MTDILNENISHEELKKYIKEFYNYACKRHKISSKPRLFLRRDEKNADDFFGKTGYYDPNSQEIHIFIANRHPKDIVRSLAHELIHHKQNLEGRFSSDLGDTSKDGYSLEEGPLRQLELEAFRDGNLMFRDWTDLKKLGMNMNEKKLPKKVVKKAHKIADKIAKKGDVKNPYAVGMAAAKKEAGIDEEALAQKAAADAKEYMEARLGTDVEEEVNESKDKKDERDAGIQHPYPQLFDEKPRLMQDAFNKKEELVYQELLRRFLKK